MQGTIKTGKRVGQRAFSLIELLVVITIMILLAAMVWPNLQPLIMGDQLNADVQTLSGTLEQARQYAIAKNTYVWVTMCVPAFNNRSSNPKVGIIASLDGMDDLAWSSTPVDLGNTTSYAVVGKVYELPMVWMITEPTNITMPSLPTPSVTPVAASTNVTFTSYIGGKQVTFNQCVQFTPTGEARVNSALNPYIDLTLVPMASTISRNQAVLRISGITGKATIYRQ